MTVNLNNQVAVITGGSGYLCSEMAKTLGSNGATVIILGRRQEKIDETINELSKYGITIYGISADVTKFETIEKAYKVIKEKWGVCSILINGAGGNSQNVITTEEFYNPNSTIKNNTTFFDIKINDIEENFKLNFMSALYCSQVFGKEMADRKKGNIINISSMSTYNSITRVVAYGASKASLDNFTRWLAVYFSKVHVRVNAIAPGFFIGEQNKKLLIEDNSNYTPRGEKIIRNTPLERFGTSEELSSTLLYLVSEDSKFVTGQIIAVDGGFSIYSGV